jgi:GntR family transcriptional regulator
MSLGLSISPASDVPIFRQIMQQIQRAVAVGTLRVGDQLPAVRTLAETLVINPNTVARAYQELIREGLLESRSGRGVFVTERRQVFSDAERERRLRLLAEQLCHEAVLLGATRREISALVDARWKELNRKPDADTH